MTLFASDFPWPVPSLTIIIEGRTNAELAETIVVEDRLMLRKASGFPYNSVSPGVKLRTELNGVQAVLSGQAMGPTDFQVDQIWVGVDDIPELVAEVSATFEHLAIACTPLKKGIAPTAVGPLTIPTLDHARPMTLVIAVDGTSMTISSAECAPLDEFDTHLAAFQDLLTFLVDEPSGRGALNVKTCSGEVAVVHGRVRFPRAMPPVHRESRPFISLTGPGAAIGVARWWEARKKLRPVTEIAAALNYAPPSLVEADLAVSAAALDRLLSLSRRLPRRFSKADVIAAADAIDSTAIDPVVKTALLQAVKGTLNATPLRAKIDEMVRRLGPIVLGNAFLEADTWVPAFMEIRNAIAHGSGKSGIWTDDALLRATRRANRIMLALALLSYLGASDRILSLAATDLGNKHAKWHRRGPIFHVP
ncbi:HEPN domain-containing protein [Lacisediminihabitans changchengi]|uniref:ApeA N-terminal domain-containing protein n=1 Tax=Lacisediminihabitans changchengi TaxID=2787634 RepID=A0A934SPQ1_9MICO|nr:HEPN domain-containing protein [Lacisediminihabitans changchengi]MBK4348957.1 hypothetical protein [Lacisediminihabitans changchengi]